MADDKEKDKQQLTYRPDIAYQDTYESAHSNKGYDSVQTDRSIDDDTDIDIINSITNTFNEVSKVVPLLPADLQTVINGVYKPILDTWANLDKKPYPKIIPEPGKIRWVDPNPTTIPSPEIVNPIYSVPETITGGGSEPGPDRDYEIDNDGLWDIDPPVVVKIDHYNPIEIIKKEYIKNIADLFNYYANRLKDIIYHYYSEKIKATYDKKLDKDGNLINKTIPEVAFLFTPLKDSCADVSQNSKHLYDASLAMSEMTKMKMCFMRNACPVEQTLLHLKSFKTIYELRLRYAQIEAEDGSNKINAMSNNILKGMKLSYDQKYDIAFTNLYKYMNSSLDILEDVLNTDLAGLRARATLIEKGGIKK